MNAIYLDHNATSPLDPRVLDAMMPFLTERYGNPSSMHGFGGSVARDIERARQSVARLIGADHDYEIVFTATGTESDNMAIQGALAYYRDRRHVITSRVEHPAVLSLCKKLEKEGYRVTYVPVDSQGNIDMNVLKEAVDDDTAIVSIMYANNETGVIQPLREISAICREHRVLLHTDAAQTVGKIGTFVDELGVDLLSVAGHKLYAPKGIGALYVRRGVRLDPVLHGAGHEAGLRPGTENVPSIVGLGQACTLAFRSLEESAHKLESLRDRLLAQLSEAIGERLTVNGRKAPRLPNTLSVNFPEVAAVDMIARLPELCVSTGSACHSGVPGMSPTLAAMGLDPDVARGTVRISVGWFTSEEEIDRAASLLIGAWESLTR